MRIRVGFVTRVVSVDWLVGNEVREGLRSHKVHGSAVGKEDVKFAVFGIDSKLYIAFLLFFFCSFCKKIKSNQIKYVSVLNIHQIDIV